jgi:hypothetical protein
MKADHVSSRLPRFLTGAHEGASVRSTRVMEVMRAAGHRDARVKEVSVSEAGQTVVAPAGVGLLRRVLGMFWTGLLLRWAAFFGFIVSASNCPFCGRTGCPQGLATAGVAAGILAAFSKRRHRHGSQPESPDAILGGRYHPE